VKHPSFMTVDHELLRRDDCYTERGSWLAQEIIARVVNEIRELTLPLGFPCVLQHSTQAFIPTWYKYL
jgi:hypothetical protein